MRPRIIILIILIGAVAYTPWWFGVLLALLAIGRLGSGYELLLPAVIADLVYGTPISQFFGLAFPATVLFAFLITLFKVFRNLFFFQRNVQS